MSRVSRSAVQSRKNCKMQRFRRYHWGGQGLIPVETIGKLEAIRGTASHGALERHAMGKEWEEWLNTQFDNFPPDVAKWQSTLSRRAVKGWLEIRWPQLSKEYRLLGAEIAWNWFLAPDVMMPFRMDKVLEDISTSHRVVFDYKFIGSMDLNWPRRMAYSDQTLLYLQGLKERLAELDAPPVDGIIYDAIIVGQWDAKKGIQKSPFVSAYDCGNGRYSPDYVRGAELISILEWSDDQWMKWIKKDQRLNELYITTGLVNPPSEILLQAKESTIYGEREWDLMMLKLEDLAQRHGYDSEEYKQLFEASVEKNPDYCLKYGWERACEYYDDCWLGGEPDGYVPREDHHREDRE